VADLHGNCACIGTYHCWRDARASGLVVGGLRGGRGTQFYSHNYCHASRAPIIVVRCYKYTMDTRRLKVTVAVGVGGTGAQGPGQWFLAFASNDNNSPVYI